MGLDEKDIEKIRYELETSKKPLFFFDDDPDGLSSFLLLYRKLREGKGLPVKSTPRITEAFLRKVEEYAPDKIFVLDTVMVDDAFIEKANRPIVWIDHHELQDVRGAKNVLYFNPLSRGEEATCTTDMCYRVADNEEDLWIAGTGIAADWQFTDIMEKVSERYPDLLPPEVREPDEALFNTQIGKLARIFSFILMGDMKRAMACVKILTRIKDPYELLNGSSSQAKYVLKKYREVNDFYEKLLSDALKTKPEGKMLIFAYENSKYSLTKDLSNELLFRNKDKTVIVARRKNGEMKMSLRSSLHNLPPILESALAGLEGFGGGHEHACGAVVSCDDFDEFLKRIRESIA